VAGSFSFALFCAQKLSESRSHLFQNARRVRLAHLFQEQSMAPLGPKYFFGTLTIQPAIFPLKLTKFPGLSRKLSFPKSPV
jgi:hypothetical protein